MLDLLERFSTRTRSQRVRFSLGVALALALVVPAQALVRHSAFPRSTSHRTAAGTAAGPKCSYVFYDPKPDATGLKGQQEDNIDLVEGNLGLNSADTTLRVVLTIKNLNKTIPPPATYLDYFFYWTNPKGDSGPNAVDVTVNSGKVTFTDGTVTVVNGSTRYVAAKPNAATGKFGSGPNGKIEVDVPLKALRLKVGQVLGNPVGGAGSGASTPAGSLASVADTDNGKSYKLDQPTCIDKR